MFRCLQGLEIPPTMVSNDLNAEQLKVKLRKVNRLANQFFFGSPSENCGDHLNPQWTCVQKVQPVQPSRFYMRQMTSSTFCWRTIPLDLASRSGIFAAYRNIINSFAHNEVNISPSFLLYLSLCFFGDPNGSNQWNQPSHLSVHYFYSMLLRLNASNKRCLGSFQIIQVLRHLILRLGYGSPIDMKIHRLGEVSLFIWMVRNGFVTCQLGPNKLFPKVSPPPTSKSVVFVETVM